jgi:hypothetical protein
MDGGLLPTGNRHTRHLTTFSFFSDPMMYISLEPHTHIYIYTHTSVRLLLFYWLQNKKKFNIDGNSPVHFHLTFLCPSSSSPLIDFLFFFHLKLEHKLNIVDYNLKKNKSNLSRMIWWEMLFIFGLSIDELDYLYMSCWYCIISVMINE